MMMHEEPDVGRLRKVRATFFALLGLASLRFALRFGELPKVVASHFGFGGRPNGWMPKESLVVFSALMVGVVFVVAFLGPLLMSKIPVELINLPNKAFWLSPEWRERTYVELAIRMGWFGCALLVFFAFVNELVFAANARPGQVLNERLLVVGLVVFLLFLLVWTAAFYRRFRVVPSASAGRRT